jgi:hypothetical protein
MPRLAAATATQLCEEAPGELGGRWNESSEEARLPERGRTRCGPSGARPPGRLEMRVRTNESGSGCFLFLFFAFCASQ